MDVMQNSTAKPRINRHVFASISSTGFLTIVPVILYSALIISSGDIGGPLNLIIIPMASVIIGIVVSLAVFLPVSFLADCIGLRRWQQVTGILTALLLVGVIALWIHFGITKPQSHRVVLLFIISHFCFYFLGGFFVYLSLLRFLGDSSHNSKA